MTGAAERGTGVVCRKGTYCEYKASLDVCVLVHGILRLSFVSACTVVQQRRTV